jgi:hypothetical protein
MSWNSSEVVLLQRRLVRGLFAEDFLSHELCVMWDLLPALELKKLLLWSSRPDVLGIVGVLASFTGYSALSAEACLEMPRMQVACDRGEVRSLRAAACHPLTDRDW